MLGPYADALRWNRGQYPIAHCPETAQVSEFTLCWPPVAAAIAGGTCTVYAFGVAKFDAFSETMAAAGCHVFAFDPGAPHPLNWRPNVTFHHWGLLTGVRCLALEHHPSAAASQLQPLEPSGAGGKSDC
jgi:hypothetical protein